MPEGSGWEDVMREASYLCSVLDDAAARGQSGRLSQLAQRWTARAHRINVNMRGKHRTILALAWSMASAATSARARAIDMRLDGRINDALMFERDSEFYLKRLAHLARRKAR
jgi:hypothetical protein